MLSKEKKYKANELYVGLIAKQSKVSATGTSIFDYTHHWTYDNFDIGIFIKKKDKYYRISTDSIYPISSWNTAFQIVINKTALHNLALLYPDFAKDYPVLTKKQILDLEKTICAETFDKQDKNTEATLEK